MPWRNGKLFSCESSAPFLSVIVPTFNEVENICELLRRIEFSCRGIPHEVVVVDDGSSDGTADTVEHFNSFYGNVRVLRRSEKLGLCSAFLYGVNKSRGEVIALIDADLQHPPELLPKLYRKILEGYDLCIASRYVDGGGVEGWGFIRKIISIIGVQLAHLLILKTRTVKDPLSGYFMVKKTHLNQMRELPEGFKVLISILALSGCNSIIEVPYIFTERRCGKSKFNIREVINFIKLLLWLNLKYG